MSDNNYFTWQYIPEDNSENGIRSRLYPMAGFGIITAAVF
jgi:hypothetical protein